MIGGPYVWMAGAVGIVLALGGAYVKGRTDGNAITRAEYQARDLQSATEAAIAYKGIAERYRAQENRWQNQIAAVSTGFQRKLDANATALLVAESVRLRDPFATDCKAGGDSASKAAANSDPASTRGAELSPAFAQFLRSEASRADAVVLKLNLCIDVLESER